MQVTTNMRKGETKTYFVQTKKKIYLTFKVSSKFMETLIATEVHDDKANRALEDDHVAERILELIKCEWV